MTNLKSFGSRTLVGNWWEERITLEAQWDKKERGPLATRDMDIDTHIHAYEECPKWRMSSESVKSTSYQDDTNPERLEERQRLQQRVRTAEKRRRLEGTVTVARSGRPGATETPAMLSRQFIDPHKVRMKTVYMKTISNAARPATATETAPETPAAPERPVRVRHGITDSTWNPSWGNSL